MARVEGRPEAVDAPVAEAEQDADVELARAAASRAFDGVEAVVVIAFIAEEVDLAVDLAVVGLHVNRDALEAQAAELPVIGEIERIDLDGDGGEIFAGDGHAPGNVIDRDDAGRFAG